MASPRTGARREPGWMIWYVYRTSYRVLRRTKRRQRYLEVSWATGVEPRPRHHVDALDDGHRVLRAPVANRVDLVVGAARPEALDVIHRCAVIRAGATRRRGGHRRSGRRIYGLVRD